jgi:hypothetical protein
LPAGGLARFMKDPRSMAYSRCAAFVAIVLLFAGVAGAQTTDDAGLRLGPLTLTPAVTLTTLTDTNVFNEPENPHQDLVTMLSPKAQALLRIGSVLVDAKTAVPYTHFTTFGGEGGFGSETTVRASVLFSRVKPYVEGAYQNLKERQNFEIDLRARRVQRAATAGTALRLTPHITLDMAARRQTIGYADNTIFRGVSLNDALSEKIDTLGGTLGRSITPLTDIVVSFEKRRDRFDFATVRDADSQRLMVGLQSAALLHGRMMVGYGAFTPLAQELPEFKGVVMSGGLEYPFFGSTLVAFEGLRDVGYSYDALQPYYVMASAGVSVTQPVPFGLIAHGGAALQRYDYRGLETARVSPRTDTGTTYSGGLEYRPGRHISVGGSFEAYSRTAQTAPVSYQGRRVGASVGYVF